MIDWVEHTNQRNGLHGARLIIVFIALLASIGMASRAQAAPPPPVQHFYVPLPEDQILHALRAIYPGPPQCASAVALAANPINTYISISALSDQTIIYYDHWEDGFEIDVTRPKQATTQIWGDGNPSNGAPPGIPADLIMADTVILLDNPVDTNTRQSVIDFDGGDRVSASNMIAMTRAAWATGSSTLLAGAVEAYDTNSWGTTYEIPVGENVDYNQLFEYSSISVMAAQDNTTLFVDFDGNGTIDGSTLINQGQAYHVNGKINAGSKISATAPIQVSLLTGDVCSTYESRWFALFPNERWSSSYYNPVGTAAGDGTTIFLYNSTTNPLTIQWETAAGAQPQIDIAPRGVGHVVAPEGSGSHFYTADGTPFMAVAAIDSDQGEAANSKADWGFTLVPERLLTQQIMVGWGPGRDPLSGVRPTENGSPVWVMPILTNGASGAVNICIDYDGDAVGPLTDSFGTGYDRKLTLDEFTSATIYDPDGDQTGMILYICDMPIGTFTDYKLTAAWGQQPGVASADAPGLDLGTTAPPAASFAVGKAADLAVDADNDGEFSPGDTILYTILIRNTARIPIDNVILRDTTPDYTTYVEQSTIFDNNGSSAPLPDNSSGTPMPLDDSGVNLGTLPVNGLFTVTFQALMDSPWPLGVDRVRNRAVVNANDEEKEATVETPVDLDPVLTIEKATNDQDADVATGPYLRVGDPVTWTYVVRNTGQVTATNVTVTDNITGVTPIYVSGDTNNDGQLVPGEIWRYQATGTATAGQYSNIGTVQGTAPDGERVTAQDPSHYFGFSAAIEIIKRADQTLVPPGTEVTYSYTVRNTGNVPLSNITVTDDHCAPVTPMFDGLFNNGDINSDNLLDPAEVWYFICMATLTDDTTNIATVTGNDPLGGTVTDQDEAFVDVRTSGIDLVKVASSSWITRGTTVVYSYTVTNIGDDPLRQVAVVDDKCSPVTYVDGDVNSDTILDLTEVWRYRCSAVITVQTTNIATVTALDSFDNPVTDEDRVTVRLNEIYIPIITVPPPPPKECPPPTGCPIEVDHLKEMAVHTGRNQLFITSRDNDRLAVVDIDSATVISQTATGDQPWGVVVNEVTGRVYVSNYGSGDVWVYDVTTLALLAKIPVGGSPALMALLPEEDTIFVVVRDGSRIAVIQGLTRLEDIPSGGSGPYGIAADTVNKRIFVSHRDSRHLSVIRQEAGSWQAKSTTLMPEGTTPFDVAYNAAINRLYVVYADSNNQWSVDIWKPELAALWGREATVRVGSGGNVADIAVGGTGLAVNPTTGNIFNANTADGTLSVISGSQQRVIATLPIGTDPFPVAVNPVTNVIFVGLRSENALVKVTDTFTP